MSGAGSRGLARLSTWGAFVKIEHTLFSLPLLFAGAFLGAGGLPAWSTLGWILVAGAGARTAALGINRIVDRDIDADNPRTASRELPRGAMSTVEAVAVVAGGTAVYLLACLQLPPICLWLSPIPLLVFVVYPYMKRFTPLAHFGVGTALALAPLGGHVAVTGTLRGIGPSLWLAGFTLLWVAGFDVIYATLDEEFDRRRGLHSLPVRLGSGTALRVAALLHGIALAALVALYTQALDGTVALVGLAAVAAVLVAEHRLAERVNLAFFHLNIVVGFLVLGVVIVGQVGW